jgi:hypothetical protein
MTISRAPESEGFTLVELVVSMAITALIGILAFAYMRTGMLLFAKNVTTNFSSNTLRRSIDNVLNRVQNSVIFPVLISSTGSPAGSPAAGIYYDRLLGDPYVVTNPSGAGLVAGTTTLTLTRSTSPFALPPIPQNGDVLLIAGAPSSLRPMVASATASTSSGSQQSISVTLSSPLASAITWTASQICTAQLIRREALIVKSSGSQPELRCYPSFETTTNLNDSSQYFVVSNQVGNQGSEVTPFSIVTSGTDTLLGMDYVVRAGIYQNYLANREANQFSSYQRVRTTLPLRLRPAH